MRRSFIYLEGIQGTDEGLFFSSVQNRMFRLSDYRFLDCHCPFVSRFLCAGEARLSAQIT